MAEAAPALGPWIATRTSGAIIGLSSELTLGPYPVATALCEIGNPAIPTIQQVLDSGRPGLRYLTVRVLSIINTPEAKAALRDDLQHESDPDLRAMIKQVLEEK
jgi:hypothetical protein